MKKLIAAAILAGFAFTAQAKTIHADVDCQGVPAEMHLTENKNVTIIADGVMYPFSLESVTIPNMGNTDVVVMVRAKSQSGKEAAFSYTRQSLNERKMWLLVDGAPEKECRIINSWVDDQDLRPSRSRVTVTHEGE